MFWKLLVIVVKVEIGYLTTLFRPDVSAVRLLVSHLHTLDTDRAQNQFFAIRITGVMMSLEAEARGALTQE